MLLSVMRRHNEETASQRIAEEKDRAPDRMMLYLDKAVILGARYGMIYHLIVANRLLKDRSKFGPDFDLYYARDGDEFKADLARMRGSDPDLMEKHFGEEYKSTDTETDWIVNASLALCNVDDHIFVRAAISQVVGDYESPIDPFILLLCAIAVTKFWDRDANRVEPDDLSRINYYLRDAFNLELVPLSTQKSYLLMLISDLSKMTIEVLEKTLCFGYVSMSVSAIPSTCYNIPIYVRQRHDEARLSGGGHFKDCGKDIMAGLVEMIGRVMSGDISERLERYKESPLIRSPYLLSYTPFVRGVSVVFGEVVAARRAFIVEGEKF
jgi:hypothetical protein